jgi:hypothetical protein
LRQTVKRRKSPINEPEYGLLDKVNWVRGLMDVFNVVYPALPPIMNMQKTSSRTYHASASMG